MKLAAESLSPKSDTRCGLRHRTKIVATLGPSSSSPEMLKRLLAAGVDVFRLNASHGTREERASLIRGIRKVLAEQGQIRAILLDLQGPKIRLGRFASPSVQLKKGCTFHITAEEVVGTETTASTSYAGFCDDVRPGDRVLLADGTVELVVRRTTSNRAECEVVRGGSVSDHKGVNLPGVDVRLPTLTAKDEADLESALELGTDLVALSFVRRAEDVQRLRQFLRARKSEIPIIAKIETWEAWVRIDDIVGVSDGLMIARGDLGVESSLEEVPHMQKAIIEKGRCCGRFVITATQMLESMIRNSSPTRAEVSDVANAIYDGTDALMLSGETAEGHHPEKAVEVMAEIASATEKRIVPGWSETTEDGDATQASIIADAAVLAARRAGVSAVAVFTMTGRSAQLISKRRPAVPIFAFTTRADIARQLSVCYGVRSMVAPELLSIDDMLRYMNERLAQQREVGAGQRVLFVAGDRPGTPGTTNTLKIHRVAALVPQENQH